MLRSSVVLGNGKSRGIHTELREGKFFPFEIPRSAELQKGNFTKHPTRKPVVLYYRRVPDTKSWVKKTGLENSSEP
jgi:hypothetical protein